MEENIYQMMRAWIQAEQLAIEHVRDRRQRMPVLGMHMGERPPNPAPAQPRADVRVIKHVKRIVVIDELMLKRLPKNRPRQRDQKNANTE